MLCGPCPWNRNAPQPSHVVRRSPRDARRFAPAAEPHLGTGLDPGSGKSHAPRADHHDHRDFGRQQPSAAAARQLPRRSHRGLVRTVLEQRRSADRRADGRRRRRHGRRRQRRPVVLGAGEPTGDRAPVRRHARPNAPAAHSAARADPAEFDRGRPFGADGALVDPRALPLVAPLPRAPVGRRGDLPIDRLLPRRPRAAGRAHGRYPDRRALHLPLRGRPALGALRPQRLVADRTRRLRGDDPRRRRRRPRRHRVVDAASTGLDADQEAPHG